MHSPEISYAIPAMWEFTSATDRSYMPARQVLESRFLRLITELLWQ